MLSSYLGGGILAGNAIRTELEVRLSTLNVLVVSIIQMTVDDLLGEGQRMVQPVLSSIMIHKALRQVIRLGYNRNGTAPPECSKVSGEQCFGL